VTIAGTVTSGNFGQVDATGSAALAGTPNINVISSFTPTVGDIYLILTYASKTGTFGTINGLNLPGGLSLTPAYNAKNFTLTVTKASGESAPAIAIGPLVHVEPSKSSVSAPDQSPAPVATSSGPDTPATSTTPARSALSPWRVAETRRSAGAHPGHARLFHSVRRGLRGAGNRASARAEAARSLAPPIAKTFRIGDRSPR
jgi:hypothetical protein